MKAEATTVDGRKVYSVRAFNQGVATYLQRLPTVWVEGEITELRRQARWASVFFTLKDPESGASLSAQMPRGQFDGLRLDLVDGERVHVFGRPELYAERGDFHLRALTIERFGLGAHLAALERLKRKLAAEGLFDASRKRPLPRIPSLIGLVTGNDAAAKRDVLAAITSRFPPAHVLVAETYVQGPRAAPAIATAIGDLSARGADVIVLARGGGSFEDLLPFSDERLVRAVASCPVPVVSAVGHEDVRRREARLDRRQHVALRRRVVAGDEADPARQQRQRALALGREQPFGRELRLQPLERSEMRADAEALDRERPQTEISALLEQLGAPVHVHALAVCEVEPQPVELAARHRHTDRRAVRRVLQREEDARPASVAAKLRDFAFHPDGGQPAEPLRDAAVERGDGIDRAVVVRKRLDLRHGRSVSPPVLQQDLGCGGVRTAVVDELDRDVQIGLARCEALRDVERIAGLDEDVQAPALDFRALVRRLGLQYLGRLAHAGGVFVFPTTNPARVCWPA